MNKNYIKKQIVFVKDYYKIEKNNLIYIVPLKGGEIYGIQNY